MGKREYTQEEQRVLQKIGKNISRALTVRGKTAKDVAKKMNINQNTISHIRTGQADPRALTLLKMSQELNVNVADFFKDIE